MSLRFRNLCRHGLRAALPLVALLIGAGSGVATGFAAAQSGRGHPAQGLQVTPKDLPLPVDTHALPPLLTPQLAPPDQRDRNPWRAVGPPLPAQSKAAVNDLSLVSATSLLALVFQWSRDAPYVFNLKVMPLGDVTLDGVVDTWDLEKMGVAMESPTSTDSLQIDLNQDGKVDILDLVILGQHFGESDGEQQL